MSCNSCAKPFSLLRNEKGCPGCGYSYCSKCLNSKIFLSKLNTETKVCAKCLKNVSTPIEPKIVEAPDAYYRRISAIAETNSYSSSVDQQIIQRLQKLKEGRDVVAPASTIDEDIKKRLQNIKGDIPSTSEAELHSRLAKLKGIPVEVVTSRPVLPTPDTRTEQEQANDLIKQYMEQISIDSKYKDDFDGLISEMESRMLKLKGSDSIPQSSSNNQEKDSDNEEESVKKIVEKLKAEAILQDDETPISDELPYCEICNEDARVRCIGCRYLFCKRCFSEHKDDDDGCDRYESYEAPKHQ